MNILINYESLELGGQQTYFLALAREFQRQGHNVYWSYLYGEKLVEAVEQNFKLFKLVQTEGRISYRENPINFLKFSIRIRNICKEFEIDHVISGSGIGAFLAGVYLKGMSTKNHWFVGGSTFQVNPTMRRFFRIIAFDWFIDKYIIWPELEPEFLSLGVKNKKFICVNFAVDTEIFCPGDFREANELRRLLGIEANTLVIGWVGRVADNMQVWNTYELFKALLKDGVNCHFLSVGGGEAIERLKQMILADSIDNSATVVEWVSYDTVAEFYNVMDIVPLLESDPHGGSIMREAMACGRVCISVDGVSGVQRSFIKKSCGILVPADEYLTAALHAIKSLTPEKIVEMGKNARIHAKQHLSFRSVVEKIAAAL